MAEHFGGKVSMGSDDDDDDGWDEVMDDDQNVQCVFCNNSFPGTVALWEHCVITHQFKITDFIKKFGLDFYGYIKLINFLRKEKPLPSVLLEYTSPYPWDKDTFLQPVIEDDPLLQHDIENSDDDSDQETELPNGCQNGVSNNCNVEIKKRLKAAEERARVAELALSQSLSDLESMRVGVHSLVLGVDHKQGLSNAGTRCPNYSESVDDDDDDEDQYFSTYSHYSIHEEMLKDEVRTLSYKNFMHKNNALFEGKVVLDIGCGSGILSIFAAQAGAKKVIGIDKSSIIYQAMDIVRENKFDHIIKLMRGKVEEIVLEVKQVDVIISEWMGYFLLFESMLDTVLFARDKWLTDDGKVYPDKCTMSIVGLGDDKRRKEKLTFWENVYGVKMSCMKRLVLSEPIVDVVEPNMILTSSSVIKEIDVNKVKVEELDFKSNFQLEAIKDGTLNIVLGYFDIFFEEHCTQKISFSTHPKSPTTHWKQTIFNLENPISLEKGEVVTGSIQCKKNKKDVRSLDVVLEIQDNISKEVIINKYTL